MQVGGSFLTAGRMRVNHLALYDSENVEKLGNGVKTYADVCADVC
jgi:hypothetical protein